MKRTDPLRSVDRQLLQSLRQEGPRAGAEKRGWARLKGSLEGERTSPRPSGVWAVACALLGLLALPTSEAERLEAGDVVRARTAEASFRIGERSTVRLDMGAELSVEEALSTGEVELSVRGGGLFNDVVPMPGVPYRVRIGAWSVEALGTRFSVSLRGEDLDLELDEGKVRVTGPGVQVVVQAPAQRSFVSRSASGPVASMQPVVSPSGPERLSPERLPSEASPPEATRPSSKVTPEATRPARIPRRRRRPEVQVAEPAPPPGPPVPSEAATQPAESDAEPRAVKVARPLEEIDELIEAERWSEADRRLRRLLERLPRAPMRARRAELRIAIGLGEGPRVRTIASRLLGHPELGPVERTELRYWRGEFARRAADCSSAESDFRSVALARHRRSEDAAWSLAWCLAHRGEDAKAEAQVQAYLRDYPAGRFAPQARAWLEK